MRRWRTRSVSDDVVAITLNGYYACALALGGDHGFVTKAYHHTSLFFI